MGLQEESSASAAEGSTHDIMHAAVHVHASHAPVRNSAGPKQRSHSNPAASDVAGGTSQKGGPAKVIAPAFVPLL